MEKGNFTFNWPHVGNDHIIEFLSRSIINNNVTGTYIFYGPDNLGKTTMANYFAQSLLCQNKQTGSGNLPCGECLSCQQFLVNSKQKDNKNLLEENSGQEIIHSDFYLIKRGKDKKNISINEVRDFINILSMSSFLNSYKIGLVKHAEDLSIEAANALLKTLEEPRAKVVIILITSNFEAMPATIVSRSQILKFNPVSADIIYDYLIKEHKASRSVAKNFSRLCLGRPALAIKFLENKDFYEIYLERIKAFINMMNQDINARFKIIEELLNKKIVGQEAVRIVGRILEIWQGLVRDLLLLEVDNENLIQHELVGQELFRIKDKLPVNSLLNLLKILNQAKEYLRANVNPKIVLENIAINI